MGKNLPIAIVSYVAFSAVVKVKVILGVDKKRATVFAVLVLVWH